MRTGIGWLSCSFGLVSQNYGTVRLQLGPPSRQLRVNRGTWRDETSVQQIATAIDVIKIQLTSSLYVRMSLLKIFFFLQKESSAMKGYRSMWRHIQLKYGYRVRQWWRYSGWRILKQQSKGESVDWRREFKVGMPSKVNSVIDCYNIK